MKFIIFLVLISAMIFPAYSDPGGNALAQSMGGFGNSMMQLGSSMMYSQRAYGIEINNFDLAHPAFSEAEKSKIFSEGYYCSNYGNFMISGRRVSANEYMTKIGFNKYVQEYANYKRRDRSWGWWLLASGLCMVGSPLIMGAQDDWSFSNPVGYICFAGTIGTMVTLTGGLINFVNRPVAPPFDYVASTTNSMNRALF